MNLKIALLQLLPGGNLDEQLHIGKTACIKAKDMGVLLYTDFGFVKNGNFMQYKL